LAEDLRACIARTAADFHELEALRRERDGVLRDAIEAGVEADVSVNPETLRAWASAWAEQCAVQESWTDWLPWSARARLARHLRLIERELRPCLSLAVWSRIGTLDDVGRGKLATVVERAARWLKVLARWHEAEPRRVAVARQYTELRSRAAQLELGSVPTTDSPEDWQPLVAEFDRLAREAAAATGAWKRREQQLALQARITRIAAEWNALASGVPAKDTWCDHAGASFDRAIRALASTPDLENVKRVRTEIYSASLAGLLEAWGAAIEHQRVATSAQESLGRVSTAESRIAGWWEGRSAQSVVVMKPSTGLPPPQILASADARMAEVTMWCDRWEKFWREEEPELSGRSRKEFAYASERLLGLVDMLPAGSDKDRFSRSVEKITDGEWHVEELRKSLERFDPDRIRAKIAQFDAQLERASFDDAKANWLERLRSDQEAIRAVNELERVLSRQRVECKPEQLPLFREALRLVPIWITTAQASQAIPIDAELFDLVVIDEASQCTLTNLLPLLFRGKRLAIIGDAEQLPAIPTIQETEQLALAKKYAVEGFLTIVGHAANDVYKSATETLPRRRADVLMLDEHYRSHPQIIGFSNQHIYQHRLQLLKPPTKDTALPFGMGVHRVSVMGIAERGERGRSWINEPEAEAVIELLQKLRATGGGPRTVGVVTPFAAQKMLLRNRLEQLGIASEVLVDTAYGFQGDERDVIIFSPVVAKGIEPASAQWVESPPNLVNVALTRARDALFVVADFDALAAQKGVLGKLARYCKDIQTLRDSSPAELALFSWMTLEGWAPSVHPIIGDHEADFVLKDDSRGTRLAIEVDGAQHRNSPEADAAIDAYLEGKGYQVLRLPARLVLESPHDVIHQIRQALKN
jgi:very-short-patch-repair endonuclease